MTPGYADTSASQAFRERLAGKVLEIGTRRWGTEPTHHKAWAPDAQWVMSDAMDGRDVDVVSDAHYLSAFDDREFDAAIAVSVFEHVERPWIVANAMHRVLKPGGIVYVGTHFAFPRHGYPSDYWRFTEEALALIFADAGFTTVQTAYTHKAKLIPPPEITVWDATAPVWLNVEYYGEK